MEQSYRNRACESGCEHKLFIKEEHRWESHRRKRAIPNSIELQNKRQLSCIQESVWVWIEFRVILKRVLLRISLGLDRISGDSKKGLSTAPCFSNHFKRKEKWSQPMADGSSISHGCKKRSTKTRQIHLYIGPMAERRSIPSVSIGTRLN